MCNGLLAQPATKVLRVAGFAIAHNSDQNQYLCQLSSSEYNKYLDCLDSAYSKTSAYSRQTPGEQDIEMNLISVRRHLSLND